MTGTLPPIAQMGHVEKIVEVEQNHPAVQQAVAQNIAREELHRQNSLVPQVDVSERSRKVNDREARQDRRRREGTKNAARSAEEDAETDPGSTASGSAGNPFAGKIVNVKI